MAVSLIAKPFAISPAFNPLWYIYDSTNKNNEGFKYIFDIYEAGTANKIAERKVSPRYDDGYGQLNLAKLLQGFVSHDFDPAVTTFDAAENSYYQYDVKIGEEYVAEINYTSNLTQDGTLVKITVTHSFQVGDTVVITQDDGGVANPSLEGLFVVTAINGTTDFTVNSLWAEVTDPTIDGSVRYSDNRKTVTRDIRTDASNLVFNGTFPFIEWPTYDEADYILDANTDKLLTDLPDEFTITETQDIWINALTQGVGTYFMYFENSTGDVFRKQITSGGQVDQILVSGDGLQGGLTLVSGSGSLVEDDVTYYDFYMANSVGVAQSQSYRLHIDRRCKINNYELAFMDRKGSFLSYAFQLRDALNGKVNKTNYNQEVEGAVKSSKFTYKTHERGMRSVDVSIEETYTLRTNYIKTQPELDLFKQLVSSPEVYMKLPDTGDYIGVTVMDDTYNVPRLKNKRLQRFTLKVKPSNQDIING